MARRIQFHLTFFLSLCEKDHRRCPKDVSALVLDRCRIAYEQRTSSFGNGRDVRNFYERLVKRQKSRIVRTRLSGVALSTFILADAPAWQESAEFVIKPEQQDKGKSEK